MSLITRCPACGTMFKVVPDQLRISDGWVRCGQCAEVFEAPEHLQPEPLVTAPATEVAPAALDARPEAAAEVIEQDADDDSWDLPPGTDLPPPEIQPDPEPDAPAEPGPADEVVQPTSQEEPLDVLTGEPAPAPVSGFLTEPSAVLSPEVEPGPISDPTLQEVSFVRQAQRKALWQRPRIRHLLMAACAVLLVLLGLQWLIHERDRIAAFEPRARGLLQGLCVPLRCTVAPLRQIESIVVDSSSFKKIRDGAYQLSLTIKNTAPVALAMPSVELALTDTQDQPVLRRVLSPTDLGAAAALAAGAEWTGSLPLSVADNTIAARIAGYRVLAFYP